MDIIESTVIELHSEIFLLRSEIDAFNHALHYKINLLLEENELVKELNVSLTKTNKSLRAENVKLRKKLGLNAKHIPMPTPKE